jgi:hypothetical protein
MRSIVTRRETLTVQEFIDQLLTRLEAQGMSPDTTKLTIKIPGRTDGYCAGNWDLHPSQNPTQQPLLIINPYTPD